jgi:RNA polymerase sigma-70 factor, ECF subfamily
LPDAKPRTPNNRIGSIGSWAGSSQTTNSTAHSTPPASAPTTSKLPSDVPVLECLGKPGEKFSLATRAGQRSALARVVELLTDDALLTMPPQPLEYQGRDAISAFLADRFATLAGRRVRLVATRANSQPAFGHYIEDGQAPIGRFFGVLVLTLDGDQIAGLTRFGDTGILPHFGLPRTLRDLAASAT